MDLESALTFPMEDDNWLMTILIGGVLSFLGFLIVPVFVINGYFLRVSREAMAGSTAPPEFSDYGDLVVDGLKAAVIVFVYQLVPLIVFGVVAGGSFLAILSGSDAAASAGLFGILGGFAVYSVLAIIFGYFGFAGLMNFVATDSMGAAFDFGTITSVATDSEWMIAWAYVIGINIALSVVISIVGAIPILGWILLLGTPFVYIYAGIVMYRIWGESFASVTATAASTESTTAETV